MLKRLAEKGRSKSKRVSHLGEDETTEMAVRKHLESLDIRCDCIEACLDEFITPEAKLIQQEDGPLVVSLGNDITKI